MKKIEFSKNFQLYSINSKNHYIDWSALTVENAVTVKYTQRNCTQYNRARSNQGGKDVAIKIHIIEEEKNQIVLPFFPRKILQNCLKIKASIN